MVELKDEKVIGKGVVRLAVEATFARDDPVGLVQREAVPNEPADDVGGRLTSVGEESGPRPRPGVVVDHEGLGAGGRVTPAAVFIADVDEALQLHPHVIVKLHVAKLVERLLARRRPDHRHRVVRKRPEGIDDPGLPDPSNVERFPELGKQRRSGPKAQQKE